MTFLWLPLLLAVMLVPVGIVVARRIDARRRRRMLALTGSGWAAAATAATGAGPSARGRLADRIPAVLAVAAFVLFAIAVARPQATIPVPRVEGTVVLTFDVSGSMAADDVTPSRMEAAKTAAKAIVERKPPGVVVGVVAFSDSGLSVQTPTADEATILQAIDRLGPARGTSLGQGILASLGAIELAETDTPPGYYSNRSPEPTAAPTPVAPGSHGAAAIVLFSDGENNERPDPVAAAQTAADRGVRIETVGVGTAAGTTLDLDGFRVQTQLDEALLRQIADLTDGTYQPAVDANPGAVYDTLAERLVARDESIEITAVVAAAGLLLLVVAGVVAMARSGRLP
jgi:Ca-activated chloride channel family protein